MSFRTWWPPLSHAVTQWWQSHYTSIYTQPKVTRLVKQGQVKPRSDWTTLTGED